jgi:hypothetical protein
MNDVSTSITAAKITLDLRFPKVTTNDEKFAFAFVCFGDPSFAEITGFCHFYGCDIERLIQGLVSLSAKGFIKIEGCLSSSSQRTYLPVFFLLTEKGTLLFKRNYALIMDFLVGPKFWGISATNAKKTLLSDFKNLYGD